MQLLRLREGSAIFDVGCGPGWFSHYLGKLGYKVMGIDISEELIEIAKQRLNADFPPYPDSSFNVEFIVHDIEENRLTADYLFDAAVFESTMHHFYDPVSALKNVARCLKEEAVVVIVEGFAPEKGTAEYEHLIDVMERYHTLERPFTIEQITRLLGFAGLKNQSFINPVTGFTDLGRDERDFERLQVCGPGFLYIFASRMEEVLKWLGKKRDFCMARIMLEGIPEQIQSSGFYEFKTSIKNLSSKTWFYEKERGIPGPYVFSLSYHWLDVEGNTVIFDGLRTALPHVVEPDQEVDVMVQVEAPNEPGR